MTMENVEVTVRVSCADCANWSGGCRRNWKVVRNGVCSKFYMRSDRAGFVVGNEIDRRFAGGAAGADRPGWLPGGMADDGGEGDE